MSLWSMEKDCGNNPPCIFIFAIPLLQALPLSSPSDALLAAGLSFLICVLCITGSGLKMLLAIRTG